MWQQVGRVEDLPKTGSFLTYDILDDSVIVVRTGPDTFTAHHNVCMHRGRRLVDTPERTKNACGHKKSFVCGFHGWTYSLDGDCTHIPEQQDWQGSLTPQNTHLAPVHVDTWGGWIWINLDPDCEPLRDYLEPAATMLDPFCLQNMRVKWRKWLTFQCNWKVAIEAFNETYHVATTHPQFNKFGTFRGWAKAQGKHSNIGYDAPKDLTETKSKIRLGTGRSADFDGGDAGVHAGGNQRHHHQNAGGRGEATGRRAAGGHPARPGAQPLAGRRAKQTTAARGVIWPAIDPEHLAQSGTAWQIFPNFPDRAGPDDGAVLQRASQRLRPQQLHLRGGLLRALPGRPRAAYRVGVSGGRRSRLAHGVPAGFLQHGRRAARHEIAWLHRN